MRHRAEASDWARADGAASGQRGFSGPGSGAMTTRNGVSVAMSGRREGARAGAVAVSVKPGVRRAVPFVVGVAYWRLLGRPVPVTVALRSCNAPAWRRMRRLGLANGGDGSNG